MAGCFQMTLDARPYTAAPARISLEERNPAGNPAAAGALRGSEPPPPARSFFAR
jgi:hypothetical protein